MRLRGPPQAPPIPSGNIASIWSGCGEPNPGFPANAVVSSMGRRNGYSFINHVAAPLLREVICSRRMWHEHSLSLADGPCLACLRCAADHGSRDLFRITADGRNGDTGDAPGTIPGPRRDQTDLAGRNHDGSAHGDAPYPCHYLMSMRQERYCHIRNWSYGSLSAAKARLPHGVDHVAWDGAVLSMQQSCRMAAYHATSSPASMDTALGPTRWRLSRHKARE